MPFTVGDVLCCAKDACVRLDTTAGSDSESWETIPHVTEISFTETANTSKLVTSSTAGRESSVCGTVAQTGTLAIACHNGVGPVFCINDLYHIAWSIDCDNIASGSKASWTEDSYYEALIRITSKPVQMQISSNAAVIYTYNFDINTFYTYPTCETADV